MPLTERQQDQASIEAIRAERLAAAGHWAAVETGGCAPPVHVLVGGDWDGKTGPSPYWKNHANA